MLLPYRARRCEWPNSSTPIDHWVASSILSHLTNDVLEHCGVKRALEAAPDGRTGSPHYLRP